MRAPRLLLLGFLLIFAGFAVAVVGAFSGQGGASTGGFILIGPFPIVFGSGPGSGVLVWFGLAITLAVVVLYLVMFLLWRSARGHEKVESESE